MRVYLLDTNHASRLLDFVHPLWDSVAQHPDDLFAITLPTAAELSYMVEKSQRAVQNKQALLRLLEQLLILPFEITDALLAGEIRGQVQKRGYNLSMIDTMIAAAAQHNNAVLLTSDSDFQFIPDIDCENWLK